MNTPPSTIRTIRAGAVADVLTGEVLADHAIIVDGERIAAVEPWSASKHGGADVLDLSEHLVAPGLIDLHTHLVGELDHGSYSPYLTGSAARDVLLGVRHASATLRAGFTTVRDVGSFRAFTDCDLRDAIDSGICEGPRMVCAGAYVTCSSGGGEITDLALDIELPRAYRFWVADSADEVRSTVRRIAHRGADVIKIIATGAVYATGTIPGAPEYSEAELRACVEEAALNGLYVAAHAHGEEGALRAIRAGVRTIEHGTLLGEAAMSAMLDHGTYYVPTTYLLRWLEDHGAREDYPSGVREKTAAVGESARTAVRLAIEAGVRIAYGTDAIVFPHGRNAGQLEEFVEWGMTPMQALQSATSVAAECIGRSEDVGAIAPGRYADLVAVRGAHLDEIGRFMYVSAVLKGGALVV
ncbi:amidohydrolase family protein [Microbacterium sp. W4I20]|uniref:metal-dependent hydrolase family protein n=1 Tax=Microbacterium sp. W4I20 TaxID=3042262 RepID=UPI00278AEE81|nr:amidohydrolase family protein [Microbacterium sp. W4I20]MDQ0728782.1 imidazolonepropionase-like amidohydrolase [Microbacterium sp. W4I20]